MSVYAGFNLLYLTYVYIDTKETTRLLLACPNTAEQSRMIEGQEMAIIANHGRQYTD
jgi:hypothetical protein